MPAGCANILPMVHLALCLLCLITAVQAEDFRPWVRAALEKGENHIVIPPGVYRLGPDSRGELWNLSDLKDVKIVADGVTLVGTKLMRAVSLFRCSGVTLQGLTDRMGNGFVFRNNRIHSPGRVLLKAGGLVEANVLDTPHALVVCAELPGQSAIGIENLTIRNNTIRRRVGSAPHPGRARQAPFR